MRAFSSPPLHRALLSLTTTTPRRLLSRTPFPRCYADYETFQIATVRKEAPLFTAKAVVNGALSTKPIALTELRGRYVVLLFYPLDFTFVCPTELLAYNDRLEEFTSRNTTVLAISVDSVYSHQAWCAQPREAGGLGPEMKLPLLSDLTKEIAKDYGVLVEEEGVALRGQFIIDKSGVLRQSTVNDLPIGRSVEETLRLLQAVQYADEHKGEVMPCNWKPGTETIKTP